MEKNKLKLITLKVKEDTHQALLLLKGYFKVKSINEVIIKLVRLSKVEDKIENFAIKKLEELK